MASGGLRPMLLLLLALLPAGLAFFFASRSAQEFVARHVDFPRSRPPPGQQYCDYIMRQWRSLPGTARRPFIFVHADPSQLASLCRCGDGSQPLNRTCISRNRIPTTTCRMALRGLYGLWGSKQRDFPFLGSFRRSRIRVACRGGEPVGVLGTV
ncbi:ribonuclease-like [Pelodiscus sinensis]|uniref:ribonuclease-like n=1 Tax=Pelodiscus sinensis TaxID=13735 RepID=UPI003F6B954A